MGKLDGKIALITGGSEGMGFGTAEAFVAEGAYVFITGRRQAELDKAVERLGTNAFGIQADVSRMEDLDRTYAEIKERKGRLDVLFANAGIFPQVPFAQVTEELYDSCFGINVKGLYFSVQKALPLMDRTGSVLLNGSFLASAGIPGMSVYAATKAAVRNLARTLTAELRDSGPRVNVLSTGWIRTEGFLRSTEANPEVRELAKVLVPLGRTGESAEVGRAAVFLVSGDASFVAGADLLVDGGVDAV